MRIWPGEDCSRAVIKFGDALFAFMAQNYGLSLLLCYDVCEGFFAMTEEPLGPPSLGREMILFCPALRRLLKYWNGSRVEAEGADARSE